MVIDTLSRSEIRRMAFGFASVYINAMAFEPVIKAVKDGKIKVQHKASLGSQGGVYRYTANTLFLGFTATAGSSDREALIVHECTHAACDVKKKTITVKVSEAIAYVAQVLYFYYRNEAAIKKGAKPTFKNPILKAAWDVAMIARHRSSITDKEAQPLYQAIAAHPLYKGRHDKDEKYDGV